jgi:hypothetical protein
MTLATRSLRWKIPEKIVSSYFQPRRQAGDRRDKIDINDGTQKSEETGLGNHKGSQADLSDRSGNSSYLYLDDGSEGEVSNDERNQ